MNLNLAWVSIWVFSIQYKFSEIMKTYILGTGYSAFFEIEFPDFLLYISLSYYPRFAKHIWRITGKAKPKLLISSILYTLAWWSLKSFIRAEFHLPFNHVNYKYIAKMQYSCRGPALSMHIVNFSIKHAPISCKHTCIRICFGIKKWVD